MMDCRKVKNLIPFAADVEIEEALSSDLQRHISHCESCREYWVAEKENIRHLNDQLTSAASEALLPSDFASSVAAMAKAAAQKKTVFRSIADRLSQMAYSASTDRRMVAAAICTVALASVGLIGFSAGRMLDSSPVVSSRVTSGHLVSFTVHPKPDGVEAGFDTRRYCRVSRPNEETLR